MDGLRLLHRAQEAGLAVQAEGNCLVIRGPKGAAPIVRLLAAHKADVLAALRSHPARRAVARAISDDPENNDTAQWRKRYITRTSHWFLNGRRAWHEAERLAFGEMIVEWQRCCGVQVTHGCCAGCGEHLPDGIGLLLDSEGNRVHFDAARGVDCIIAFGMRWRGHAVAGLRALKLHPPDDFKLL